ncbi:tetratricopeptide repeat protein [Spirulina major]|uniref:tetratricopeptide repeat protein n=1 Tax=Spirulina major TaxID=270636 RepID=UPI0009338476|nr:tetratricopeptide repeat protein [Spirulina major]
MSLLRLTVFSGLVLVGASCAGLPSLLGALGSGGSGVAGGVAANALGDWLDGRKKGDLSNHDLTKAVGSAIARSVSDFALKHVDEKALKKLAKDLPEMWPSFAEPIIPGQTLIQGIQEDQLTAWLTDPESQRAVLDLSEWKTAIAHYFCPAVEIELSPQTVTDLAAHLQDTFAFALREVLKADFETGGKAFAGMTLSLLGEILRTVQGLQVAGTGEISPDVVNQIQARYEALQRDQVAELQKIAAQIGHDLKNDLDELKHGQGEIKEEIRALKESIQPQAKSRSTIGSRPHFRHFQGRKREQEKLNAWLTDENTKLSGIIAMAGMGKSTLAVKLFEERDDFAGKGWFDLGLAPKFETVARSLLQWGEIPRDTLERMQFEALCDEAIALLQNERFLVVLDNFESVLNQGEYITFLQRWVNGGRRSEVLLTSQQEPELDQVCPAWCVLPGLELEEGARLLALLGIGEREPGKLAAFSRLVDGHPLTLTLAAGLLNSQGSWQRQKSIEELKAPEFGGVLSQLEGQHRNQRVQLKTVLAANFGRLSAREREVLTRLAVLRGAFGVDVVAVEESGLFWGLVNRGLLTEQANGGVTVLPFVRSYLLAQVTDRAPLHRWAIAYYDARKKPYPWDIFEERDRELAEVQDYLELFHHHCELGEHEQAFDVIDHGASQRESVNDFLDLRGFQQERIALYEPLIEVWRDRTHWRYGASLTCLGIAHHSLGDYKKAIDYHKQSLAIARQIKDKQGEAASLGNLGVAHQSLGEVEKAIDYDQQCLLITRQIKDKRSEAASLGSLGDAYQSLGEVEKAINYHEQSLVITRQIKDKRGEANSLGNLGNAYQSLGEVKKAIDYHEQCLAIAQQIKDKQGEVNSLGSLGLAYKSLGEVKKAIGYYEQCLAITRQIKDKRGEAASLGNVGNAYDSLGEVEKAINYHEQSLVIAQQIKDKRGEANSLGNLGNAYQSLGEVKKAIDYHEQHLVIAQQIKDKRGEANSLGNLGNAYYSLGEVKKAIDYYEQSLVIARQIKDKKGEANSFGGLGNTYYSLRDIEKAIGYYEQQLMIARQIKDKKGEANSLGNLGNAYNSLGEVKKAIDYYEQSLVIERQIKDKRGEAISLQNLAACYQNYQKVGRIEEGYAAAVAAQQVYQDLDLPLNAPLYPQWLKRLITFAQKGTVQFILLCVLGLIAVSIQVMRIWL